MSEEPAIVHQPALGHESIGAFNMEMEFRNKIEAEARDARKALDEANTRMAAVQSDHDSMKAALETERQDRAKLQAAHDEAQAAMLGHQANAAELQAKLDAANAELAELKAATAKANKPAPPPAALTEEAKDGADAGQGTRPAA